MAFVASALPYIAAATGAASAGVGIAAALKKPPQAPKPPAPPSQDTAANSAAQQALALRRRQGVLANILSPQGQSQAGVKTALGT